ncbi:MAG TPA: dephospho-CoA kinase [Stellaceae bacterium]
MIILGLTGGVGMGKSTAAMMLRRLRVPVHDADATVHRLLTRGGDAVDAVARVFPDALRDGAIDRKILGARVFSDRAALRRLERILHPLVRRDERRFLRAQRRQRARLVVLDIPLLFETGGQRRCDAVVTVSAPAFLQRRRVLARPGMNAGKLKGILAAQVSDARRRRDADFIVPSGLGRAVTFRRLRDIVRQLTRR